MILPSELAGGGAIFHPGRICITEQAHGLLSKDDVDNALRRHLRGDWGEMEEEDREANERALCNGSRLFSLFLSAAKERFYIITEANRSCTTILMPSDY